MDEHDIIAIGFGIVGGIFTVIGWFLKAIYQSHSDLVSADRMLSDKVYSIELLVTGAYVKRDDFERLSSALFNKLDKIYDKLDCKVDK